MNFDLLRSRALSWRRKPDRNGGSSELSGSVRRDNSTPHMELNAQLQFVHASMLGNSIRAPISLDQR